MIVGRPAKLWLTRQFIFVREFAQERNQQFLSGSEAGWGWFVGVRRWSVVAVWD